MEPFLIVESGSKLVIHPEIGRIVPRVWRSCYLRFYSLVVGGNHNQPLIILAHRVRAVGFYFAYLCS